MKTEQQIRDYLAEQKRWFKLMDGADPEFRLVEGMIESLEFVLDRTNEQPDSKLPDGLQKYMDGVALNILYRKYYKSTNGIWSRAEIEFEHEDEQGNPYYEVNIGFGCQDDTRNEQYSETMYSFKKGDEWTCTDDYCESCSCRGWIESNDEEGRDAIQRCDECKVFDTDEYAQKIYDQECKDYFNKEKV